jgi:hypothetical protein
MVIVVAMAFSLWMVVLVCYVVQSTGVSAPDELLAEAVIFLFPIGRRDRVSTWEATRIPSGKLWDAFDLSLR